LAVSSFSSRVARCATTAPNNGVVALRMAARPLAICTWPHTISTNGTTLLSSAMPSMARRPARSNWSARPCSASSRCNAVAANATRANTIESGGTSPTATPIKKNEPPHKTERASSSAQVRASMRDWIFATFMAAT